MTISGGDCNDTMILGGCQKVRLWYFGITRLYYMKLKLFTHSTQSLTDGLALINQPRKYVLLKFTPTILYIILVHETSVNREPQIWCKIKMTAIFDMIELQSNNDNIILIEINGDLLMQTLKHFEKANSEGLNIRLQRKDVTGSDVNHQESTRNASLALFYSHINSNANTINHTFKIPVKILKSNHNSILLREPELNHVDLYMHLPNAFVSTYKRLDKFRKTSHNDVVTIRASRRRGGFLGFVLEEPGKFKVTISWNEALDIRKPSQDLQTDSLIQTAFTHAPETTDIDDDDVAEDKQITVKIKDWKMASKIVANCHTVILLMAHDEACVLHCLLEDSDDIEVIYYINAIKVRDEFDV